MRTFERLGLWSKVASQSYSHGWFFQCMSSLFLNALMLGAEMTSSGRLFQSFTIRWLNEWALILVLDLFLGSLSLWPRVVESFTGDSKLGRVGLYTLCSSL